jgi:protein-S-isoprenylcysteine O-methyltransferase Ste14
MENFLRAFVVVSLSVMKRQTGILSCPGVKLTLRRGGTWIQRWRVPLGFLCAALFILFARPRPATLLAGAAVSLIGLFLRAWGSGHLRKNDALATSGPYAYTRNPLYLGSFIMGLGFTIASGRWALGILFLALFLGIYLPVMRVESATLAQLFGERFHAYSRAVPLFLPRLTAYREGQARTRFDGGLYMRYREYQAALGLLIAWALLVIKAYYLK